MTLGPWARPLVGDTEWRRRAACRGSDPGLFFPSDDEPKDDAKALCRRCPVRQACLDFALANREDHGIWGGTGARERERIRRARARGEDPYSRVCKRCGGRFPIEQFPERSPGHHRPQCGGCWRAIQRELDRERRKRNGLQRCKRCQRELAVERFSKAGGRTCDECWDVIWASFDRPTEATG